MAVAAMGMASGNPRSSEASRPSAKPNVIWIVCDALRPENLSCYGYERTTSPNIDALAQRGILCENHYAQAFATFLSVPSYMSGRYFPVNCLDAGNWRDHTRAPSPDETLLPIIMHGNGYRTYLGTTHSWFSPTCRLCRSFERAAYLNDWPDVYRDLRRFLRQRDTRPFLVYLHLLQTHFPHELEAPFNKWVDTHYASKRIINGSMPIPSEEPLPEEDRRLLRDLYDGAILSADHTIGQILELLRNRDLIENTIIIIGSDHGETLGEDGRTVGHAVVCEEVMRVPLVACGPGLPQGVRVAEMTENVDLVPTLTDLLGLETQAAFDGRSLVEVLREADDRAIPPRDFVVAKGQRDGPPQLVLRDLRYAYVYEMTSGEGLLYDAPFTIAKMQDRSSEHPEAVALMNARVTQRLLPKWEAAQKTPSIPPQEPFLVAIEPSDVEPSNAVVSLQWDSLATAEMEPGQWLLAGYEILITSGDVEPRPLDIRLTVPNGRYHVQAFVKIVTAWPLPPIPFKAFRLKVQEDETFRTIAINPWGKETADLGMHEVRDGVFRFALHSAAKRRRVAIGKLLFTPQTMTDAPSRPEELLDRREKLRALGYL